MFFTFAQQVAVHNPAMLLAQFSTATVNGVGYFSQRAGDQHFIRGADLGAPIDVHVLRNKPAVGVVGVEHHQYAVHAFGEAAFG